MSDPHLVEDSELLARAVRGELSGDDHALRELLRRRPAWADVLEELADGAGEGAPAELRAFARRNTTSGDRERMRALVNRIGSAAPSAPRRWRLPVLLAAALLAVLGVTWWSQRAPEEAPRGPFLGSGGVSWVAPTDTVEAWDTFVWEAELPRRGSFALTVRADDAQGTLLAREDGLREPRWSPDPSAASTWPDAIVVTIEVLQPSGISQGALEVPLRRSPR